MKKHHPYLLLMDKQKILFHLEINWPVVDRAIRFYIKKLNEIPGLATIQSCAGHSIKTNGPIYHDDANLWIWLSESTMRQFRKYAYLLSKVRGISRLYIMYCPRGEEYISIEFDSIEERKRDLRAIRAIVKFFRFLSNRTLKWQKNQYK